MISVRFFIGGAICAFLVKFLPIGGRSPKAGAVDPVVALASQEEAGFGRRPTLRSTDNGRALKVRDDRIKDLLRRTPQAAFDLICQQVGSERTQAENVLIAELLNGEPADGIALLLSDARMKAAFHRYVRFAADKQPSETLGALCKRSPDPLVFGEALSAVRHWAFTDPRSAAQFINGLEADPRAWRFVIPAVWTLTKSAPRDAIVAVSSLPPSDSRQQLVSLLTKELEKSDVDGLIQLKARLGGE